MDGVLCTVRAHLAQKSDAVPIQALDREGIGLLNLIHEYDPETRYVLSSTWRRHYEKDWMENHLKSYGWTGQFHDDWRTKPFVKMSSQRINEIEDWIERNQQRDRYVILDDIIYGNGFTGHEKVVQTHCDDGISYQNFHQAFYILHGISWMDRKR